nr:excalibur calcium-binding domain-containing protein [Mycolicibacterium malmesburyense]CRL78416.1 excalibur domain-containing protein [Mycolicibacterium malmesburyense]
MATAAGAATASADTYYKNCSAAREAGVTPILVGQDGYAEHLDRDGDGVACE